MRQDTNSRSALKKLVFGMKSLNSQSPDKSPSPMTAEHRQALLTVLRFELREGWTVEEAANRHSVPLDFALKATKSRRRRRTKAEMREASDGAEALRKLSEQLATLDATVYELIDLLPSSNADRR